MAIRKTSFLIGEYYHIYNRGVDKRIIFSDENDIDRFFQSMKEFNVVEPIGSIYQNSFRELRSSTPKLGKLVDFIAYCLNPNHYHFIITPVVDKGIEKFMQKLGTGYVNYFNSKYDRSGALLQGKFKAVHISNNEYLLHVGAYVNLNDRVHKLDQLVSSTPKLVKSRSSWAEYMGENKRGEDFCNKEIILKQFKSKTEYKKFAESALKIMLARKSGLNDLGRSLLE